MTMKNSASYGDLSVGYLEEEDTQAKNTRSKCKCRCRNRTKCQWRPTSAVALAQAERKMLDNVWHLIENKFVTINDGSQRIRTITLNPGIDDKCPLVLVHGMGAGVGFWTKNLESLSKKRTVHAFDMLGFGRSSRPKFNKGAMTTEETYVNSFEQWRQSMGLENFILLGHSMGGFLSACYALRHPTKVHHLILADPWGFHEPLRDQEKGTPLPLWIRTVGTLFTSFNPLAGLRAAGPWGPGLVNKLRPDLLNKFAVDHDVQTVADYIYHCNAQNPSGEKAFRNMAYIAWAKHPLIRRVADISDSVAMTLVLGEESWLSSGIGDQVREIRRNAHVDVKVVDGAGHHVYADRAAMFNDIVNRACAATDVEGKRDQ